MLKKIVVRSSDGETFEVNQKVAIRSMMKLIEDDCPDVTSVVLAKVLEFSKKHLENKHHENTLLELVLVMDYVDIKELADLICQKAADLICQMVVEVMKRKSAEEIRRIFEEEEEVPKDGR